MLVIVSLSSGCFATAKKSLPLEFTFGINGGVDFRRYNLIINQKKLMKIQDGLKKNKDKAKKKSDKKRKFSEFDLILDEFDWCLHLLGVHYDKYMQQARLELKTDDVGIGTNVARFIGNIFAKYLVSDKKRIAELKQLFPGDESVKAGSLEAIAKSNRNDPLVKILRLFCKYNYDLDKKLMDSKEFKEPLSVYMGTGSERDNGC